MNIRCSQAAVVANLAAFFASNALMAQTTPTLTDKPVAVGEQRELVCRAYCSEDKPRTAIVELSWRAPALAATSAERVDVTIYKRGFGVSRYASMAVSGPGPLQLEGIKPLHTNKGAVFGLSQATLLSDPNRRDRTVMRMEGGEPGVNYYWRVLVLTAKGWISSETASCEIPVCTADEFRPR